MNQWHDVFVLFRPRNWLYLITGNRLRDRKNFSSCFSFSLSFRWFSNNFSSSSPIVVPNKWTRKYVTCDLKSEISILERVTQHSHVNGAAAALSDLDQSRDPASYRRTFRKKNEILSYLSHLHICQWWQGQIIISMKCLAVDDKSTCWSLETKRKEGKKSSRTFLSISRIVEMSPGVVVVSFDCIPLDWTCDKLNLSHTLELSLFSYFLSNWQFAEFKMRPQSNGKKSACRAAVQPHRCINLKGPRNRRTSHRVKRKEEEKIVIEFYSIDHPLKDPI